MDCQKWGPSYNTTKQNDMGSPRIRWKYAFSGSEWAFNAKLLSWKRRRMPNGRQAKCV